MQRQLEKVSVALVVVGLVLLAASWIAATLVPRGSGWSDATAMQLQQAAANYHDALHGQMHMDPAPNQDADSLSHARAEYESLQAQLTRSQSRTRMAVLAIRWSGIVLAVLGVALYIRRLG